jgi:hypothetical protein
VIAPEWQVFVARAWPELAQGGRACAPAGLPHPSSSGFKRPLFSEAHGQLDDWTASLDDGSRVHLHEYPGGSIVVHRDRTDPARGPLAALWHFATETGLGRLIVKAGGVVASVVLWRKLA